MPKSSRLTLPKTPLQTQAVVEFSGDVVTAAFRSDAEVWQNGLYADKRRARQWSNLPERSLRQRSEYPSDHGRKLAGPCAVLLGNGAGQGEDTQTQTPRIIMEL